MMDDQLTEWLDCSQFATTGRLAWRSRVIRQSRSINEDLWHIMRHRQAHPAHHHFLQSVHITKSGFCVHRLRARDFPRGRPRSTSISARAADGFKPNEDPTVLSSQYIKPSDKKLPPGGERPFTALTRELWYFHWLVISCPWLSARHIN